MITLVVGGQYGGEGKGKISAFLSTQHNYSAICRTGSVNSKHTVSTKGEDYDLRHLPTACAHGFKGKIYFGAGSIIHIPTLFEEIKLFNISNNQIVIDNQAGVLNTKHTTEQRKDGRYHNIGSTLTGTGYATAERAMRKLSLARDVEDLQSMLGNVPKELWNRLSNNKNILVEGHQGAGLSNLHGDYPYVSNRDCIAAELLSELGVGPRHKLRIILVLKVFPTRNHNGLLPNEMTKDEIRIIGIEEYGGGSWNVGNKKRRVGKFDFDNLKSTIHLNTPTEIALTGIDYYDKESAGVKEENKLSKKSLDFIKKIEKISGIPVNIISTGPDTMSTIYRKQK